jgi:cobalt-zinc-cadmium efflux system outer membrane protein
MSKGQGHIFPGGGRRSGLGRKAASPAGGSFIPFLVCMMLLITVPVFAAEETLKLPDLIREALKNNPEIHVAEARANASTHRIPQAMSLADPMMMMGYENEGTNSLYTFGGETKGMPANSRWMFSLSQMFLYPGKRALKGEMATYDVESLKAMTAATKLATEVRVKELYYDLFLAYANIDLLTDQAALFSRLEDAALARYAAGMAPQQEVLMAQTEKYMLIEREEMEKQKIQSLKAMLNAALGRDSLSPLGRPEKPQDVVNNYRLDELIRMSYERYPMIKSREKMANAAEAKVQMAKKEYYPDFTIGASYFARSSQFPDMWNLTATINLPIFYKTKQREGVLEAEASLLEARRNVEATKLMTSSALRDNYAMFKSAENLMALYRDGLIPKAYQGFELALAGYVTGKIEALTAITRLKALIDYEFLYWRQFTDRQKAAARLDGLAAITDYGVDAK